MCKASNKQSGARYAEEKFSEAVRALTLGGGNIKERLKAAYGCFHPVTVADLPDHLKVDFEWIKAQLLAKPPLAAQGSETIVSGSLEQTLHAMPKKTGITIAKRIVHVRDKLHEYNNTGSAPSLGRNGNCTPFSKGRHGLHHSPMPPWEWMSVS